MTEILDRWQHPGQAEDTIGKPVLIKWGLLGVSGPLGGHPADRGEFAMEVSFYGDPPGWWITVERLAARRAHRRQAVADRGRMRQAGLVILEVRRIAGDGSIRRVRLDTAGRDDAARWEQLARLCYLELPPPYHPVPGQPVYQVCAGDQVAQTAEDDLVGPLRELITSMLAEGGTGQRPRHSVA